MNKRGLVLLLGLAALGTLGGMAPWAYRRIRVAAVLAQLQSQQSPGASQELLALRALPQAGERLAATSDPELAANLLELARNGQLDGPTRRRVFDISFPVSLQRDVASAVPLQPLRSPDYLEQLVHARAQESTWELVSVLAWGPRIEPPVVGPGRVVAHAQYFLGGKSGDAHLVHQRMVFVLDASDPTAPGSGIRLETQDLTAVPDPINLYLRRPVRIILPSGESALELRLASMGTWRQFVPGQKLAAGSVAYTVHLDRAGTAAEPLLLGRLAVSDAKPSGQWHGEDAVRRRPLEHLDRGSHWIDWVVPESQAKLRALDRLKLLFRPAPAYARELGFEVTATECLPFEREYFLPEPEK